MCSWVSVLEGMLLLLPLLLPVSMTHRASDAFTFLVKGPSSTRPAQPRRTALCCALDPGMPTELEWWLLMQ
eukprot:1152874-Pelagomonas_calceolata.AAC.2